MTDKKIRNFCYMTFFLDKETKKPAIICKQKNECRPPKSIEDFKNDGGDLIHDYEVAECNLKEAEKDMPEEDGEYKGKHLDDTESWERAVCDKYNLITSDEIEFKFEYNRVQIEWEDGTFVECDKDEFFEDNFELEE